MQVGVEGINAVLYVEGEGVDIEVTGTNNSDRYSEIHLTITGQVQIGNRRCLVFLHTVRTIRKMMA